MENFEVPTQSNRLIRYQSNLFQVMLLSRGKLPARTLKDKDFQRELKTIIALFLRDAAMGQHKQDPICGKRVRVAMRTFQGSNVQDVFEFSLRKKPLKLNPTVFSFIVTAL